MISALKPVWDDWLVSLEREVEDAPEMLLKDTWISWKLGDGMLFELSIMGILARAAILPGGQLHFHDAKGRSYELTSDMVDFGAWDIFGMNFPIPSLGGS